MIVLNEWVGETYFNVTYISLYYKTLMFEKQNYNYGVFVTIGLAISNTGNVSYKPQSVSCLWRFGMLFFLVPIDIRMIQKNAIFYVI